MWVPLRNEISQGDIFQNIPFPLMRMNGGEVEVKTKPFPGMLLTYDCEYDKKIVPVALLAQVRLLTDLPESSRKSAQDGKIARCFYIGSYENGDESYVEFGNVATVPKLILESLSGEGKRIASLDDEARVILQQRLAVFFGLGRG